MSEHAHRIFKAHGPIGVFVYRNLRNNMWSLRATHGLNQGRVIAHAVYLELFSAQPKVSEAGRQRVLQEKRKNVHAGLQGSLVFFVSPYPLRHVTPQLAHVPFDNQFALVSPGVIDPLREVTYNPYKGPYFHFKAGAQMPVGGLFQRFRLYADGKVEALTR